jgi:hypothetical protein
MDGTTVNGELNHKLESRGFDGNDGLESHMASVKRMRDKARPLDCEVAHSNMTSGHMA